MITEDEREYARCFINDHCIARVPPGSKRMPSYGGEGSGYYTWQFYLRAALFNPVVLDIVVRHFLDQYETPLKLERWQLCGVESASTPILTAVALECHRRGYRAPVFSIRKERKTYGLQNWLEGSVLDRPAMLVDDLTSENHKTAIHAAAILRDHGIPVCGQFYAVVFKSKAPERDIKLLRQDVRVVSLFDLTDFDLSLEAYAERKAKHLTS